MDTTALHNVNTIVGQLATVTSAIIALVGTIAGFIAGFKHGNNKRRRAIDKR